MHYFLTNPIYCGHVGHKGLILPGQQEAIIGGALWTEAQDMLQSTAACKRDRARTAVSPRDQQPIAFETSGEPTSHLAGKIFDETGDSLRPSQTNRLGRPFAIISGAA